MAVPMNADSHPGVAGQPSRRLSHAERVQIVVMATTVTALFTVGFVLLLAASPGHFNLGRNGVFGIGTGILALTLGMRHAFDADHISAIDNTTRKLMSDGKRPLSVGFFFSLGHSTVVFVLAVLLGFGIRALDSQVQDDNSALHNITGIIGTCVSGGFLYLIAALNVVVLFSIVRIFRRMRAGHFNETELEQQLQQRGFMNRILGSLAQRIDKSWKIYPIGVLFGLGFDTATEVALLVLSGSAAVAGLPWWAILSLPLLFAAGMSLFDSLDGTFMNFAYGWAFSKPIRKVYYNLVITALSVAVAVIIGSIELLSLLGSEFGLPGGFWAFLNGIDINTAGFIVVGLFIVTWLIALGIWHFGKVEARWEAPSRE